MELVQGHMPEYKINEDLEVVHRANKVGAMRTEVWTLRPFEANELLFCPWTTEIKDRLWTQGLSAHLELPRDALPTNRLLALDGRNRAHLAHPDPKAHIKGEVGSLFWAITRTSEASNANMHLYFQQGLDARG